MSEPKYEDLLETVRWIAGQTDLFFAECSQAEEIVSRCRQALAEPPARKDELGTCGYQYGFHTLAECNHKDDWTPVAPQASPEAPAKEDELRPSGPSEFNSDGTMNCRCIELGHDGTSAHSGHVVLLKLTSGTLMRSCANHLRNYLVGSKVEVLEQAHSALPESNDGAVRRFSISSPEMIQTRFGPTRTGNDSEASCLECGEEFGVHDTAILKPKFKAHTCKLGRDALHKETKG